MIHKLSALDSKPHQTKGKACHSRSLVKILSPPVWRIVMLSRETKQA